MSYTYSKLASYTVGSGGVSAVSFLAIPQNYTDLIIKVSSRDNAAGTQNNLYVTFNGSTSGYSDKIVYGNGASALSAQNTSFTSFVFAYSVSAQATANTFSSNEIYIPNYTSANFKLASFDAVSENNATGVLTTLSVGIWANTAPISSITFTPSSATLQQHSTFTLYGIKAEV